MLLGMNRNISSGQNHPSLMPTMQGSNSKSVLPNIVSRDFSLDPINREGSNT